MRKVAVLLALCAMASSALGDGLPTPSLGAGIQSTLSQMTRQASDFTDSLLNTAQRMAQPLMSTLGTGVTPTSVTSQLGSMSTDFLTVMQGMQNEYCIDARFFAGAKRPASFVGHGAKMVLDTGNCTLAYNEFGFPNLDAKIVCSGPTMQLVKTAPRMTSKYLAGAFFVSKACNISKTLGAREVTILHSFDGTTQFPSPVELMSKLSSSLSPGNLGVGLPSLLRGGMLGGASPLSGLSLGNSLGLGALSSLASATGMNANQLGGLFGGDAKTAGHAGVPGLSISSIEEAVKRLGEIGAEIASSDINV